jgi:hypothetical protein
MTAQENGKTHSHVHVPGRFPARPLEPLRRVVPVSGALGGHVLYVCDGQCDPQLSCRWCEGGLSACVRCNAFEGMWPDECPGVPMTEDQGDAVYAGQLNYRGATWHPGECCQIMRHMYDRESYMREHGYRLVDPDAPEERWVKICRE